jgi:hypothetical protein
VTGGDLVGVGKGRMRFGAGIEVLVVWGRSIDWIWGEMHASSSLGIRT